MKIVVIGGTGLIGWKTVAILRQEACAEARPQCASNLIGVARLAFPEQLIEIVFKAVLPTADAVHGHVKPLGACA